MNRKNDGLPGQSGHWPHFWPRVVVRHWFLSLWILPPLLAASCSSIDFPRKFKGQIGNLGGHGQTTETNAECRGFARGRTDDGKEFVKFDLAPRSPQDSQAEFQLFFVFPRLPTNQVLVASTESRAVDVWLFRDDPTGSNLDLVVKNNGERLRQRGGEPMVGRVAIKWNSDADFVIGADLTAPEDRSTWVKGEFVASTRTRLNPILYDWPAILLFQESK